MKQRGSEKNFPKKKTFLHEQAELLAHNIYPINGTGRLIIQDANHPLSCLVRRRGGEKTDHCLCVCYLVKYMSSVASTVTTVQDGLV